MPVLHQVHWATAFACGLVLSSGLAMGAEYTCPSGDSAAETSQEVRDINKNLLKRNEIKVHTREEWLPQCCQAAFLHSTGCTERAQKFYDFSKSFNPIIPDAVKKELLDGDHVRGDAFWSRLCFPNEKDAVVNHGVQRSFGNGVVTVHDSDLQGDKPSYDREMKAMAMLYDNSNSADLFTKDRLEMLSALYYNRICEGWADVGYHFCVGRHSGAVFQARSLALVGAHTQELNQGNIGVCLLGNTENRFAGLKYNEYGLPDTQTQVADRLLDGLISQFHIDRKKYVVTHNFLQDKDCCLACNNWLRAFTGNDELTSENREHSVNGEKKVYEGKFLDRRDRFRKQGIGQGQPRACFPPDFASEPGAHPDSTKNIQ